MKLHRLPGLPSPPRTDMTVPTERERLTRHPAVVLLLFLAIMSLAEAGRGILCRLGMDLIPGGKTLPVYMLIQIFATTWTVVCVLLYCLLGERRTLPSLGFSRHKAIPDYLLGLAFGFLMFGGAVLLSVAAGTLTLSAAESTPSVLMLLLFLLGFLIQGMSEEMLCRSYLMVSLSRGLPTWVCVLGNALLFSILHVGNPNVSVIALINIFLFGLFASLLTLRRGSVWMAGAIHSMWNFAQGNLFGIPVSGLRGLPSPLEGHAAESTWQTLINGGKFGLEGGLAVTVILLISCALVWLLPAATKKKASR